MNPPAEKQRDLIPFNKPAMVGREMELMARAVLSGKISGNGQYTRMAQRFLEDRFGFGKTLLTTSCTDALEMAALLLDIGPDDEVIVPSFTFVSTANAFASRGAGVVFADIRPDTLNIDEKHLSGLISSNTRAIVPVHYAGVGCEMDTIMEIASQAGCYVIEDAAQCIDATWKGKALGGIGQLGAFSFHETKNLQCGEGGALCINDPALIERAEILWEKGTNRSRFFRGEVDKYTWVDVGSSFLPSDLLAAYLYAQFEQLDAITSRRKALHRRYRESFAQLEKSGRVRGPAVPSDKEFNAHIYYLLLETEESRDGLIAFLRKENIHAVFHYLPLHLSPMGRTFGGAKADCPVTEEISGRLVRLPLYHELSHEDQDRVVDAVYRFFQS